MYSTKIHFYEILTDEQVLSNSKIQKEEYVLQISEILTRR
jgi:hypothetical protein